MSDRFDTTEWSVVLSARQKGEPGAEAALARLCRTYWPPLYGFVRHRGYDADRARDLTQAYFLRLLEKDYLDDVDPQAGRFRSFLLASMKHFLANHAKSERALKRGGGRPALSLAFEDEEDRLRWEPAESETPESLYERRWARLIIQRTRDALRAEYERHEKLPLFERLAPYLVDAQQGGSYVEIARELDRSESAVRMAVYRMRRRFGELLRKEVSRTLAIPDEVDAEIRYLFEILRG